MPEMTRPKLTQLGSRQRTKLARLVNNGGWRLTLCSRCARERAREADHQLPALANGQAVAVSGIWLLGRFGSPQALLLYRLVERRLRECLSLVN